MSRIIVAATLLIAVMATARADHERGDFATALREFRPAVEAVKGYRMAAEQGNADAQLNLGMLYYTGLGVRQDYAEAVKWFRGAAEQGEADAQVSLGLMYQAGQGVPKDYVQAHMWFTLAAARGSENARKGRRIVADKMTPGQINEAQRLAQEWQAEMP